MNGFRLDVGDEEPRGGTITIEPVDDECAVTVVFRPTLKNTLTAEARAVVEGLGKNGYLDFEYVVKRFDLMKIMDEIRLAINHLNRFENRAFQNRDVAFSDGHALAAALLPLARIGHQLYTKLFSFGLNPGSMNVTSESLTRASWRVHGELLRSWLQDAKALHIVCRHCYLPWNLIYPELVADSAEAVRVEEFWGFSKRLQLFQVGVTNLAVMKSEWRLAAGVEEKDGSVADGRRIHDDAAHPFRARANGRVSWHEQPRSLFADLERDIIYHFGHASGTTRGYAYNGVVLNGYSFSSADLETLFDTGQLPVTTASPHLLYLNGCSTAPGSGEGCNSTLVDALVRGSPGTFCFVTTFGDVPPWAAAEFARRFFDSYFGSSETAPRSLGDSLWIARHEMLALYQNPIGLLYEAVGKLATRLGAQPPSITGRLS
ncbi:MAG TPA: C25 family cysteine peptidase [Kofleriaceae bacterium]